MQFIKSTYASGSRVVIKYQFSLCVCAWCHRPDLMAEPRLPFTGFGSFRTELFIVMLVVHVIIQYKGLVCRARPYGAVWDLMFQGTRGLLHRTCLWSLKPLKTFRGGGGAKFVQFGSFKMKQILSVLFFFWSSCWFEVNRAQLKKKKIISCISLPQSGFSNIWIKVECSQPVVLLNCCQSNQNKL